MPGLPPPHTAATDSGATALKVVSTILIEPLNLQQIHPQLRGSHNVIKKFVACLRYCWASGVREGQLALNVDECLLIQRSTNEFR